MRIEATLRRTLFLTGLLVVYLAVALSACARREPPPPPAAATTAAATASPHPSNTVSPPPHAFTATEPAATQPIQPSAAPPFPTPAPRPLGMVFPTPGPTPPQPWRPPTYPVPWAPNLHDHFLLARPIPAFYGALPVTDYRYGGVFFTNEIHTGIDIPGQPGTPVLAAGHGQVVWAGYGLASGRPGRPGPYGLAVMIRHDFGWQGQTLYTVYAHLEEVDVRPGWWVDSGTPLGRMGSTGHATGPHLHFEVRLGTPKPNGRGVSFATRNPELWLAPPLGRGIIVGQVLDSLGYPLYHNIVYLASEQDPDFHWRTYTYGRSPLIHSDPYYRENYTFGDLPAGKYRLTVAYYGAFPSAEIVVRAGQVTFFRFMGRRGFTLDATP